MDMEHRAIRRIVIAGSGYEAWLTAALLSHRLDGRQVDITVCPVTGSTDWDALYSALPAWPGDRVRDLGFSTLRLAAETDASFSLGTRVTGLGGPDQLKPHGPVGIDYAGVGFHQYWRRTTAAPSAKGYFAFSPATAAMRRQALAPPVPENAIGPLQHEMMRHVDPWALQKHLRQSAFALGVTESRSDLQEVRFHDDGQRIDTLVTRRDEHLAADLFIDCSGPVRALIGDHPNAAWQQAPLARDYWLHVDHQARTAAPVPHATLSAEPGGWTVHYPRGSEDIRLRLDCDTALRGARAVSAGHYEAAWQGNRVALGSAAATLLPLEPLHNRFLMLSLDRLIRLLPGRDCAAAETTEFNHLNAQDLNEAHAITALYERARQRGSLEGDEGAGLPDDMAHRLRLFAKRGWVTPTDSLLLPDNAWCAACILLGVVPREHDRLADRIAFEEVRNNLALLKQRIRDVAERFPPYAEYFSAVQKAAAQRGQSA